MSKALKNSREVPLEDKIFALSLRAKMRKEMVGSENVINATIGELLDDYGNLVVMKAVSDEIEKLNPEDFAAYAPIGGVEEYKMAIIDAIFRGNKSNRNVRVVATPGGTGALSCGISNYSEKGDSVLTSDWFWAPYEKICAERGRKLVTYELFDDDGKFNFEAFETKIRELLENQEQLLIILNTPAHNPTGYSLDDGEWKCMVDLLNNLSNDFQKNINIIVDVAYIDFAGEKNDVRSFLDILEDCGNRVFPLIAYSASKTFTIYGMRCGALLCMAENMGDAEEFVRYCEYTARSSWSNSSRAPQKIIENIYSDEDIIKEVDDERIIFYSMLKERGEIFESEVIKRGLKPVPFTSGFFACIACDNPDRLSAELEKRDVFVVPLKKGIRISLAAINKKQCIKLAEIIADTVANI